MDNGLVWQMRPSGEIPHDFSCWRELDLQDGCAGGGAHLNPSRALGDRPAHGRGLHIKETALALQDAFIRIHQFTD